MDPDLKGEFDRYTPDELRELYRDNPDRFNALAGDALKRACIGSTPEQTLKLRQMQWTIDAHLRKGKTPLERMHLMEEIFYGRVYGEDGYLAKLTTACDDLLRSMEVDDRVAEKGRMRLVKR